MLRLDRGDVGLTCVTSFRTRRYRLAVSFDWVLNEKTICQKLTGLSETKTNVFSNSGSGSTSGSLFQGIKTKLNFARGAEAGV